MARKPQPGQIAANRRAYRDYEVLEELDAGLALLGWEVKALRAGRASLVEAYVALRGGEAWLTGANFAPLPSASAHPAPVADRDRKLLLHRHQLDRLSGKVQQRGLALVPLTLYWSGSKAKLRVGLGRGRKQHDKRRAEQERDWAREKQRLARHSAQGRR
ncbi:MAG: SsrA-binding protein SmpB [Gammaproteobacteria bacterium]|nr:SsrA-binding protein SmpB [Gammaproteobacteria bacterium]MCY4340515.1 SsrA-binding protein SmpB [Gammaproteobacteria bacterium]